MALCCFHGAAPGGASCETMTICGRRRRTGGHRYRLRREVFAHAAHCRAQSSSRRHTGDPAGRAAHARGLQVLAVAGECPKPVKRSVVQEAIGNWRLDYLATIRHVGDPCPNPPRLDTFTEDSGMPLSYQPDRRSAAPRRRLMLCASGRSVCIRPHSPASPCGSSMRLRPKRPHS